MQSQDRADRLVDVQVPRPAVLWPRWRNREDRSNIGSLACLTVRAAPGA